jgi:hypothetical protein
MSLKPEYAIDRKPVYNHEGLMGWAWVAASRNEIIDFGVVFINAKGSDHAARAASERAHAAIQQYKLAHDLVCA